MEAICTQKSRQPPVSPHSTYMREHVLPWMNQTGSNSNVSFMASPVLPNTCMCKIFQGSASLPGWDADPDTCELSTAAALQQQHTMVAAEHHGNACTLHSSSSLVCIDFCFLIERPLHSTMAAASVVHSTAGNLKQAQSCACNSVIECAAPH